MLRVTANGIITVTYTSLRVPSSYVLVKLSSLALVFRPRMLRMVPLGCHPLIISIF